MDHGVRMGIIFGFKLLRVRSFFSTMKPSNIVICFRYVYRVVLVMRGFQHFVIRLIDFSTLLIVLVVFEEQIKTQIIAA